MEDEILFGIEDLDEPAASPGYTLTEKYLLFTSDDHLFGITAANVIEIITNHTITKLPLVPDYVPGIINLRGQIIPIVDIRLLLGKAPQADCCIMILDIDGTTIGIQVDAVQRMLDIQKDSILAAPAQNTQKLSSGICSLPDGQTMLVFDCAQLLNHT